MLFVLKAKQYRAMTINSKKRTTLKAMALGTSAAMLPGVVVAACRHGSHSIQGGDLVISFSAKAAMDGSRRVIVTNTSDNPITLSHVYPSTVSTIDGQYDLNSLLIDGAKEFAPHEATTMTILPHIGALAHTQAPTRSADSVIAIRTMHSNTNGGEPVITTRSMFS